MSSRTFFDMRYLFPGFTFILGFTLFSEFYIFKIGLPDFSLALLTFIGLSPLGFLFSRGWNAILFLIRRSTWKYFKKQRGSSFYFINNRFPSRNSDIKKYQLKDQYDKVKLLYLRDYFLHYHFGKKKKDLIEINHVRSYLSRRWGFR